MNDGAARITRLSEGGRQSLAAPGRATARSAASRAQLGLAEEMPSDLGDAQLVYRLMTLVPDHWIPLVPVPAVGVPEAAGAVELQRAAILRFRANGTSDQAQPGGLLLRADTALAVDDDVLRIAEEEVPGYGLVVRRIIQLAELAKTRASEAQRIPR